MRRTCQKRLLEKGGECIVLTILLDEHLKVLVDGRDGKQDAWGGARRQGEGGVKRLDWSVRAAGVRRVGSVSGAAQLRCVTPRCPSEATCTMSSRVRCMSKYLVGVSSAVQHGEWGWGFRARMQGALVGPHGRSLRVSVGGVSNRSEAFRLAGSIVASSSPRRRRKCSCSLVCRM